MPGNGTFHTKQYAQRRPEIGAKYFTSHSNTKEQQSSSTEVPIKSKHLLTNRDLECMEFINSSPWICVCDSDFPVRLGTNIGLNKNENPCLWAADSLFEAKGMRRQRSPSSLECGVKQIR